MSSRIVLVRRLGWMHIPLAIVFRLFGIAVLYIEPAGKLRDIVAVERLRSIGIRLIDFSRLKDCDPFAQYKVLHRYAQALTGELFPEAAIAALKPHFPLIDRIEEKIRIVLYETISDSVQPHALSIAVAEYFHERGSRVWVVQPRDSISARIYGRLSPVRNISPPLVLLIAKFISRLSMLLRRASVKMSGSGSTGAEPAGAGEASGSQPPLDAEVLYFPHQGPLYGALFEKGQYYSAKPASAFHRNRICHVELWDILSATQRREVSESYKRSGIPFYKLHRQRRMGGFAKRFLAFRRGLSDSTGMVADLCAYRTLLRFEAASAALTSFSRAKLALLGYEHLFPKVVCLALQGRGIKVAASQERFALVFHDTFCAILDFYYVVGEICRIRCLEKKLCCIDRIAVIGDVRTDLLVRYAAAQRPGKLSNPAAAHRCLVLDFHSVPDYFSNAMTTVNNWSSNLLFYTDILRLARSFQNVSFVIRGKDAEWKKIPYFKEIAAELLAQPNIVLANDYDRLDESYRLAASADSIVARHTSLGDQCLAVGKPVIFYESLSNTDRCIGWLYDYAPWPILAHSYEDLRSRFGKILELGDFLSGKEKRDLVAANYGGIPDGTIGETLVRSLEDVLEETRAAVEESRPVCDGARLPTPFRRPAPMMS